MLPLHTKLTDEEVGYVIEKYSGIVKDLYAKRNTEVNL